MLEILLPIIALVLLYYTIKGAFLLYRRAPEAGSGYVLLYFIGWFTVAPIMVLWSWHCVSFGGGRDKKP